MKTGKLILRVSGLALLCLVFPANASLQSEINNWFDTGYANNTSPHVYKTQMGGFYSGGSYQTRVPIRPLGGWVGFRPPHFSGGCGGIDLDKGGFNMVNKQEIIDQLRAIGQNAKSLAFSMAISYISSLLSAKMDVIKDWANFFGKQMMDSCQAATALVDGAVEFGSDKLMQIKQNNCIKTLISNNGLSEDEARTACTSKGDREPTNLANQNAFGFTNGNLAWYMMMHVPMLENDLDMAEIMMNMTGTVIVNTDSASGADGGSNSIPIKPLVLENCTGDGCSDAVLDALIDRIIFGDDAKGFKGDIYLYHCSQSTRSANPLGCDELSNKGVPTKFDMTGYPSIKSKVKANIKSLYAKVYDKNATLSLEEQSFIEQAAAPIYKYILASASAFKNTDPSQDFILDNYLDAISRELVASNFFAISTEVKKMLSLDDTAPNDEYKAAYYKQLDKVISHFNKCRRDAEGDMKMILIMEENAQKYETIISSRLTPGTLASALFR